MFSKYGIFFFFSSVWKIADYAKRQEIVVISVYVFVYELNVTKKKKKKQI